MAGGRFFPARRQKILHHNAVATRFSRARSTKVGALNLGLCDPSAWIRNLSSGRRLYTRPRPELAPSGLSYRLPKIRRWQHEHGRGSCVILAGAARRGKAAHPGGCRRSGSCPEGPERPPPVLPAWVFSIGCRLVNLRARPGLFSSATCPPRAVRGAPTMGCRAPVAQGIEQRFPKAKNGRISTLAKREKTLVFTGFFEFFVVRRNRMKSNEIEPRGCQ